MQNRSVATVVILTIITCGIYGLYWVYVTAEALEAEGRSAQMSPTVQLILSIFFGGIGYLFVGMAADANINAIKTQRGLPTTDNKLVYMLIGFFIPIVLIAMVQNEINKLAPVTQ